jgi:ArsR family transcriptional regulator, arsenate/arsenite/antimonite-responsive transcriptional repressor
MERSKVDGSPPDPGPPDRDQVLTALAALAHATRLDLIRLLMPLGAAGMPAGQIAQALGLAAPRLSFHLSALEGAGLIRARRVARNVIYTVDPGGLGRTIAYLLNDCCCDHPEVRAACAHARPGPPQGALSGTAKT